MEVCGTKNEHVEEAESDSSVKELVNTDETSATENGDEDERVGLESELFFRGN
jgi:hypothetical protein